MNCWRCKKALTDLPVKVGFRATCPSCGVDLHTCAGCRYFASGKPNDCLVPGTEYVRNRESANLCEDFKIKTEFSKEPIRDKKRFDSLFKDES